MNAKVTIRTAGFDEAIRRPAKSVDIDCGTKAVSVWISRMRAEGVRLVVHLGVPGVTELSRLMTIAARIGVVDSARYLKKNRRMVGHLMNPGSFSPDAFLEALAGTITDPVARVSGVHPFTFNQVEETAAWQQRMEERLRG